MKETINNKGKLKIIFIWAFFIGMPFFSIAQAKQYIIKGKIRDSIGNPVPDAIITLSSNVDELDILDFNTSNSKGLYSIKLKNDKPLDSVWLTIRHLAYQTIQRKIPPTNSLIDFKLFPKVEQLNEVLLKSNKTLEVKGDTITYNVTRIKTEKDYTIEEVINRIPGVTISETGQIKYEGKSISHLYINGIDLLEGRYNIATQGIPADAVKEIDIMKKHNHDRIDIGRVESDNVAFNLKIKDDVSLVFGSTRGEVGTPFLIGLAEGTPIYLKDKFQNISSAKFNNTGKTLKSIGENYAAGDLNINSLGMDEVQILRPPNVSGVILSDKFWLNNESYSITNDALHKMSDSTLLKWNLNYVNELSQIENKSITTFIINNDSTAVINSNKNQLRSQRFQSGVNQEINKRNFYLKNNTAFKYSHNSGKEDVILNENQVLANYQNFDMHIKNSTVIKTLIVKENILQSGLMIEYENQTDRLGVSPPVFEDIISNNSSNENTIQSINLKRLNISGFSQYDFQWLDLKWNAYQDIRYNNFNFISNLKQIPNEEQINFPLSSDFKFRQISTNTRVNSRLNIDKIRFSWKISAEYIGLNSEETNTENEQNKASFFLIQPTLSVRYKINNKKSLGVSYSQNNSISDFSQLYQAVVLKNYNSLLQNPNFINKIRKESVNSFFSYTDILKSLFLKLNAEWSKNKSDVTFVNQLDDEGFFTTEVIKRPNLVNNYGISLNITKGFLGKFSTYLNYSLNYGESELFFNSEFIEAINRNHSIDFRFSWDKGSWYSLEYKANLNLGISELPNNKVDNSFLFQTLSLDFYTSSSTRLNFGIESSRASTSESNSTSNNILFNTSFYYKPSKKLYLKASILNIFDTSFFSTTSSRVNFVNISQFSLRPRQFTLGLTYSL